MANAVYDPNTNDLVPSFSQIKQSKLEKGFAEIDNVSEDSIAQQNQIAPRQTRTGMTRGDQQIEGLIQIKDRNGRVVMMMGYSPGAF